MGQGACMTTEDVSVMAALLRAARSPSDVEAVCKAFDKVRRGHPEYVKEASRKIAKLLTGQHGFDPAVIAAQNPEGLWDPIYGLDIQQHVADALAALRTGPGSEVIDPTEALFHDEEIDGPLTDRLRILVLALDAERSVVASRIAGFDDVDLVGAEDVPDGGPARPGTQRAEQQLAILAVRLEMAAVYLRLVRG